MNKNEFSRLVSCLSKGVRQADDLLNRKNAREVFSQDILTQLEVEKNKLIQKRSDLKILYLNEKAKGVLAQIKSNFLELQSIEKNDMKSTDSDMYSIKNYKYLGIKKAKKNKN